MPDVALDLLQLPEGLRAERLERASSSPHTISPKASGALTFDKHITHTHTHTHIHMVVGQQRWVLVWHDMTYTSPPPQFSDLWSWHVFPKCFLSLLTLAFFFSHCSLSLSSCRICEGLMPTVSASSPTDTSKVPLVSVSCFEFLFWFDVLLLDWFFCTQGWLAWNTGKLYHWFYWTVAACKAVYHSNIHPSPCWLFKA